MSFIEARRICVSKCGRDCSEEAYSYVVDNLNGPNPYVEDVCEFELKSIVTITPEKKLQETIEHHIEMDFYQFIGNLGKLCLSFNFYFS